MENTKTPELLFSVDDPKQCVFIYKWHDHKFRIYCKHDCDTPLGFNRNCCLSVMTLHGTWVNLEDNLNLGIEWTNRLYNNVEMMNAENSCAIKGFLNYIVKVY